MSFWSSCLYLLSAGAVGGIWDYVPRHPLDLVLGQNRALCPPGKYSTNQATALGDLAILQSVR